MGADCLTVEGDAGSDHLTVKSDVCACPPARVMHRPDSRTVAGATHGSIIGA